MPAPPDPIPFLDLRPGIEAQWEELRAAAERVLRSGRFVGGPEVEAFEREVAGFLGVEHAVSVNSGTDALVIALRALGVEPGDEVITTPFTFFATAEAIGTVGAREVFADVDLDSFNLDPACVEEAITPRARAIVPVHLFGRPAEMEPLLEIAARHRLRVLEDCAQAFGARLEGRFAGRRVGWAGDVAAFSFYPTKNLGGFGDGGLVATGNPEIARRARILREHGSSQPDRHETLGYNSRLDALQAALLRVKLPQAHEANARRREAALRYDRLLTGLEGVVRPDPVEGHAFHQYTIRITGGRRDAVREALASAGIDSRVYYPVPCHRLPVYASRRLQLPVAERLAGEVLSLPLWPEIPPESQQRVAEAVAAALATATA